MVGGPIGWEFYRYTDLLAEANGYVGAAELTVRKGVNRPDHEVSYDTADVSGDYTAYAYEWTIEAGGWQILGIPTASALMISLPSSTRSHSDQQTKLSGLCWHMLFILPIRKTKHLWV